MTKNKDTNEKSSFWFRLKNKFRKKRFSKIEKEAKKAGIKQEEIIDLDKTKKVAKELSEEFSYFTLANIPTDEECVSEVYGYIKIYYTKYFQSLIDNNVIEIACFYARRHSKKEVVKLLDGIDLDSLVKTKVFFKNEYVFENYPGVKFDRAIFLAKKTLKEELTFISQKEEIEGFSVDVKLAPCNLILFGWYNVNVPILFVKDTPAANTAIHKAKLKAKKLRDMEKRIYQKGIHKLKAKLEDRNQAVEREKIKADNWKTEYTHLVKNVGAERKRNINKLFKDALQREGYLPAVDSGFNKKTLLFWLLIIGGGIAVLFIILFTLGEGGFWGTNATNSTANSTSPANETVTVSFLRTLSQFIKLFMVVI